MGRRSRRSDIPPPASVYPEPGQHLLGELPPEGFFYSEEANDVYRAGAYVRRWDCPRCGALAGGIPADGPDASRRCMVCRESMRRGLICVPTPPGEAQEESAPEPPDPALVRVCYRERGEEPGSWRPVFEAREAIVPQEGWQVYRSGTGQPFEGGKRYRVTGVRVVHDARALAPYYAVFLERLPA